MTKTSTSLLKKFPAATLLPATLIAAFVATASPAGAISRVETTQHDCSAIRGTLIREGAAILRYKSKRGLPLHDRYVSSSLLCESPSVGAWARVPARDTKSCRVIRCDPHGADDDNGLLDFRPLLQIRAP
ncbi:hypothetical protein SAMN05877838_2214 [Hoeflea halophila]|uniref:Uncharacterized protein n=1 Tax=Hoeflea halophila TaxID=714899 RepID=A0A286ICE1_9HYPH|nr:hypothetical protein [Hoeflea halophila]SOE17316.1 hypothetical protein SAMN05877838_2214 [Hoeflea halophila]